MFIMYSENSPLTELRKLVRKNEIEIRSNFQNTSEIPQFLPKNIQNED